jgi:hypothetical protein
MRVLVALLLLAAPALAEPRQPTEAQLRQQERMRQCSADARQNNLAGEARKQFMSSCLAGRPTGTR